MDEPGNVAKGGSGSTQKGNKAQTNLWALPQPLDYNIWEVIGEEHQVLLAVVHQLLVVAPLVPLHVAHQVAAVAQLQKYTNIREKMQIMVLG